MSLEIGIVGLPNVGKSTIFNALTKTKAAASANYPFCTIDPNIGIVEVPDERLDNLSKISGSEKVLPAVIKFVDIAGLVKGASDGEGLGNKFLSHIRECDAIAHVIRVFDDPNIIHVHGNIDPKSDREVIESELLIADIQTVEKRYIKAQSEAKSGQKDRAAYRDIIKRLLDDLNSGKMANEIEFTDEEKLQIKDLHLITIKPNLYIINLPESEIKDFDSEKYSKLIGLENSKLIIPVCAKVEEDLQGFSNEEAKEYLSELGLEKTGLDALIKSAYETLGLITYLTTGPKESRAWTIKNGYTAPQAAGTIHTDFEKGFIKAEVISYKDFISAGSELKAKEQGLMRLEGKEYIVKDGDVMHFKFAN